MIAYLFTFFNTKMRKELKKLPKEWTGDLVGLMHNNKISIAQLAEKLGVRREYVSMVLNGHREPVGAEQKYRSAVNDLISQTSSPESE